MKGSREGKSCPLYVKGWSGQGHRRGCRQVCGSKMWDGKGLWKELDSCLWCFASIPGVRNRHGQKAGGRGCNHRALWQELAPHLWVQMARSGDTRKEGQKQEMFGGGKANPEFRQHHSMAQSPGEITRKRRRKQAEYQNSLSLLPDCGWAVTSSLMFLLPCLPYHDGLYPFKPQAKRNSSFYPAFLSLQQGK